MSGIGIILNRNAGKNRAYRGQIGEKLAFVLGDPDSLQQTSSVNEIDRVAAAFRDRDIDILGISGGDGSNHYTLSTFIEVYGDKPLPKVAFLCGGTHNAHAASIGVRGTPEKLLQAIVQKYQTRERLDSTRRKILRVNDGTGVRYGFSLATGFMYRFYQELHIRQDDTPLKVAALIASWFGSYFVRGKKIQEMFRLDPGRITINGETLPWEKNNGVSCSAMEKLGLGFTPYPRANETPHTFQAGAFCIRPGSFARIMWNFKRGRIPEHPEFHCTITDSLELQAEEPVSYVLDGELYHGGPRLEVNTGPQLEIILV